MENLHTLLHQLSPAEKEVVRNYLHCFSSRKTDALNKSEKLFSFLLDAPQAPSTEQCALAVYNEPKDNRIDCLKSFLKNRILDALTSDVNTERREQLDETDRAAVNVKRKFAQFHQLFYTVGNSPIVQELLSEIICISKEYEYYTGLCEGLKFRKYMKGFREGEKRFLELGKELKFYEDCNASVTKANDYCYQLTIRADNNAEYDKKEMELFLKHAIAELRKDYEYTKSEAVHYHLKYLECAFYNLKENYLKARSVCLEQINIIRDNKAVFRKQRISFAYGTLYRCELFLGKYSEAVESAKRSKEFLLKESANYSVAQEQEFYALFYSKQYEEAQKISDELMKGAPKELGDFRHAKYCYLNACALFALKKYYTVHSILSHKLELSRDKTGWELGIRTLAIMTDVELLNHDEAELKVHSLQKHIDYHAKTKQVSERNKLISKYLRALEGKGFMFATMNGKTDVILEKLSSKEIKHRWEILSPELIPFHEWVGAKKGGKVKVGVKEKKRKLVPAYAK